MLSVGDYALARLRTCDPWEVVQIVRFYPYEDFVLVRWVKCGGLVTGIVNPRTLNFGWPHNEE